jgi:hypothetical protein
MKFMRRLLCTRLGGAAHALPLLFLGAGLVLVQPCAGGSGVFNDTGNLGTARLYHTATLLPNGKVLAAGGAGGSGLTSAELYDPASGTWTATGRLATARSHHTATLLLNGTVLVAGGDAVGGLASAELYDPASGTWMTTGSLATARYHHTATLLPNGKVLVVGGFSTSYLASAELYDPVSGTWTATGSLGAAREYHTATLLPNGTVLVVGGRNSNPLTSAELYDPASGTWTATGSLGTARQYHAATLLPNGDALVVGGTNNSSYLASAELYDPVSGTWTATGSLGTARQYHTATSLPNGKVLVVGGGNSTGDPLASAELYDPASGIWTATGSLGTAREYHTETLLPNGKALVAGGGNNNGALASAELYDSTAIPTPTPTITPGITPTPTATATVAPTPTATPTPSPTSTPPPTPGQPLNVSTRLQVLTGDNVLIGGFIVTGTAPKRVLIRAAGPSLTQFGVPNALANPRLELHDTTSIIGMNDDWQTTQIGGVITSDQVAEIQNSGLAPRDPLESAVIATLAPGSYTAIVQGVNGGTGVGIVEAYDLDPTADSKLANISTRGFVDVGNDVMIGGFIIGPNNAPPTRVLIRAIGPSLPVTGALQDPTLELHDGNGAIIASNDNWKDTQQADIQFTGIPPLNELESAIVQTLVPGSYTAIVRGKDNTTGVGLVEVYDITTRTLEQVSRLILASQGGVITLPGGSSVSIPAGVLANDQLVTLSLLSSMPNQPPSGLLQSVGHALSISFASAQTGATDAHAFIGASNRQPNGTGSLQFVLKLGSNPGNGLVGSAPIADIMDLTEGDVFIGIPGSFDLATGIGQLSVPIMEVQNAQTITVGQTNLNPNRLVPPPRFGGRIWDAIQGQWLDYPQGFDPCKKTLILEHGVNSSVEEAYGGCINDIMAAGGYQQVVGFNYDWTQRPSIAGPLLAAFLNALQTDGLRQADIEAHSFGTITALAAISQSPSLNIPHMILKGGPLDGTPLAQSKNFVTVISYSLNGVNTVTKHTLDEFLNSGVLDDLSPGSSALATIKAEAILAHNNTSFIKVAGQTCLDLPGFAQRSIYGNDTNDCFIPASSASGNGLPGPAALYFPLQHDKLECDPNVVHNVGLAVTPTSPKPIIMVDPPTLNFSTMEGGGSPPNQTFTVTNVGPAGSTLHYTVTASASAWLGPRPSPSSILLSGPIFPLNAGQSATYTVSANSSGLSALYSPYTGTITVCDFASENLLQSILVTLTITVPGPLAITSQTWTPAVDSGGLHGYSVMVEGTASGPIGAILGGAVLSNNSNDVNIVAASWSAWGFPPGAMRESGDPDTTTWTATDTFVVQGDTMSISLYNPVTVTTIYVYPHP